MTASQAPSLPEAPAPAPLRSPPNRLPWEAPPPQGWEPPLRGWAWELAVLLGGLGLLAAAMLSAEGALALGRREPLTTWTWLSSLGLWILSAVSAAAVGLLAWLKLEALTLLAAMALDHRRLARIGGRPVAWLDAPPQRALRVAHLSDLHVAEDAGVRLIEAERPAGNAALQGLLSAPELKDVDALVVTGDVTDRGTADSWSEALAALEAHGLAERTVLVPGNHDLMLVKVVEKVEELASDRFGVVQLANLYKFAQAFARTAGGLRGTVLRTADLQLPPPARGALPDVRQVLPWAEAWEAMAGEVRELLEKLPFEQAPGVGARAPLRGWREVQAYAGRLERCRARMLALFPVAVPVGERGVVLVLNSCTLVSRNPATNSFGALGAVQMERLEALVRHLPQRLRLVALHHHLVRRGEEQAAGLRKRLFARFAVLSDWRPLVRHCRETGVRAVLNGHRHLSYQLRLPGGTVLLAAPSSTLGDELSLDPRPGFEVYSFAADPVDDVQVAIHRKVVRPAVPWTAPRGS
ncbi:MAG TPA: metallophosphoesterase [Myxococcales bacterium]|jgi:3',5'-cyclic AMP phosphodiesterase CpdA